MSKKKTAYVDALIKKHSEFFKYLVEVMNIRMKTARYYISCIEDAPSETKSIVDNHYQKFNKWELAKAISEKKKAEKTEKSDEDRVIKLHSPTSDDSEDSEYFEDSEDSEEADFFAYSDPQTQKFAEAVHSILSLEIDFQKKVEILNLVIMGYIK